MLKDAEEIQKKIFVHFLDIAFGSAEEVEYCILLSYDLCYINDEQYQMVNCKVKDLKQCSLILLKLK